MRKRLNNFTISNALYMTKKRLAHLSMLAAVVVLVGAGCGSAAEPTPATTDDSGTGVTKDSGDMMKDDGVMDAAEAMEEVVMLEDVVMEDETVYEDEEGRYTLTFDAAKYKRLDFPKGLVGLNSIESNKSVFSVGEYTAARTGWDDAELKKVTGKNVVQVKMYDEDSVEFGAKLENGKYLRITCKIDLCGELIPNTVVK